MKHARLFPTLAVALTFALALALTVGACSGVKKSLGMEKNSPDEFAVVERAPLTLPPDFNLMPPQPGAEPVQEAHPAATAQGLVLGSQPNAPVDATASTAEQSLLAKAGAGSSDPAIRQQLAVPDDKEAASGVAQKLGISAPENGKALDATAESRRLQQEDVKTPPVPAATDDNAE